MKKNRITDYFERGQWSVIQNVIAYLEGYQTAYELCREAGFGVSKIIDLEADCNTFMEQVNEFLKSKGH